VAIDGKGNFWTADTTTGAIERFPIATTGSIRPSLTIEPQMETSAGLKKAAATSVTFDVSSGEVYCTCVVLYEGAGESGVSQYAIAASGAAKLVRSFYDPTLPEYPPQVIHVDDAATIYVASPLYKSGMFAYPASTRSGEARGRYIGGPATKLDSIAALTTDAADRVYAATPGGVAVFGATAQGNVKPERVIEDGSRLHWSKDVYGDYLVVK
jgi:hypothetical protein